MPTNSTRRWIALLLLGAASGLPLALSGDLLAAWLTDAGFDPRKIGLLALAGLPYAFKVVWSPLLDRFSPRILGRRRGWMVIAQIALILAILVLAQTDPRRSLAAVAVAATCVAFFSATQDIVIDAWRADILLPNERGPGAALSVTGYRLGMILSSAGALVLVGKYNFSWPTICRLCAAAMSIGLIGVYFADEPAAPVVPASIQEAVLHPLRDLLSRKGGLLLLLFILLFKLPENLANAMSLPFLLKTGIPQEQIGAVRQGLGVGVTIIGTLLGGGLVMRWGIWRSLWVFGVLHSVSNLAFLVMARSGPSYLAMTAVICVENLCIGLTTAGFTAWMIGQCQANYSAFQFALFSGVMALGRVLAAPLAGEMAQHLGWSGFFLTSAATGLPGLLILSQLRPQTQVDNQLTKAPLPGVVPSL